MIHQPVADAGQVVPLGASVKQATANILLELVQAPRDGGLVDSQHMGSLERRLRPGHSQKDLDVVPVEGMHGCRSLRWYVSGLLPVDGDGAAHVADADECDVHEVRKSEKAMELPDWRGTRG